VRSKAELEIGLLLPCNVIVYETETAERRVAMARLPPWDRRRQPGLKDVAREADERLPRPETLEPSAPRGSYREYLIPMAPCWPRGSAHAWILPRLGVPT